MTTRLGSASIATRAGSADDLLFRHVRDLPYFRGLLRAVESRFYQDLELKQPVYDLGCGDGHFAWITFPKPIDVGLDPWHGPIHEAGRRGHYGGLVEGNAAQTPFADAHFASAFSNSVLEHIPRVQIVLNETARILEPGALFVFCVPNENFTQFLSVARGLDRLGLHGAAEAYRRFFNRISRHSHCDAPAVWETRLRIAGFEIEEHWDYFSPEALATLEWGHYFGLPALICKALFGRWIIAPWMFSLWPTLALVRRYFNESIPQKQGAYTFYVTRRTAAKPQPPDGMRQ
ncbi:MAG TPA: methyltransferase domain-containing protein [Anaerolineales bacterium]|nr:methyltransferase domain-containing protein [Anaerolineales bacterium]